MKIKIEFEKHRELFAMLLIAAVTFLVYSYSLNYPVLDDWDDQYYILTNKFLALNISNLVKYLTEPYFNMYYPITMYSYMFDYALWGYKGFGYHLQNVFWHVVTLIAVYKIFRILGLRYAIALLLTILFSIHPQRVESVVWLSERKDVLCNAFYLWSIFFYIRSRKYGGNELTAFVFFILAILSKPMAISLPFLLVCYEAYRQKIFSITPTLKRVWPYFAVAVLFVGMIFLNQAVDKEKFILYKRIYFVAYNFVWYVWKTLFPWELCPLYPIEPVSFTAAQTIFSYAVILVLSVYLFIHYRTVFMRVCVPIAAGYVIAIAPVAGFVPFGSFIHADRWSYIPSLFIWLGTGIVLCAVNRKYTRFRFTTVLIYTGLVLCILVLIPLNIFYQRLWESPYNVFERSSMFDVSNRLALWFYGNYLIERNYYEKLPEVIDKLSFDDNPTPKTFLGLKYFLAAYYYKSGAPEKAVPLFLEIKKNHIADNLFYSKYEYAKAISMLGNSCFMIGDMEKAKACYENLLLYYQGKDMEFDYDYYKGMSAFASKNYPKAVVWFRKAKKLYAGYQTLNNNLEIAEKMMKR